MKNKKVFFYVFLFLSQFVLFAESQSEFLFTFSSDNRMLVFAEINNIKGYFIVDTGAPDIILFDTVRGLEETKSEYDSYWLMGETFTSKRYITKQITLSGITVNGNFTILEAPETLRHVFPQEIKGFINILDLDATVVEISFSERKIRLFENVPVSYTNSIPYAQNGLLKFIPVTANNTEYYFRIDTGNTNFIDFPENLLTGIDKKKILPVAVNKYNIATNHYGYYYFKNNNFALFGHVYTDAICQTSTLADKATTGGIGMGILKNYDLVFDSATQRLFYKPLWPDTLYDILFTRETMSSGIIDCSYRDGYLLINQIIIDSPAWKAGLRPGYKITKINSYNCDSIPITYLQRVLQSNTSIRIEFFDEEKNKTRTVYIYPKKLLK